MSSLITDFLFLLQRMDWASLLDLFLVMLVFFSILMLIHDTQGHGSAAGGSFCWLSCSAC